MRQAGILTAMALAALVASPALAQQAKTSAQGGAGVLITEANLPQAYTALGVVTANVHPKSMSPKTPTHDLLDAELRRQAAALGADAVVQVRYTIRNPMMSDKGSDAVGVAVKFTSVAAAAPAPTTPAPTQLASAQPAPVASPPVQPTAQPSAQPSVQSSGRATPVSPPAPAPSPAPQVAAVTPAPQPAVKPAPMPQPAPTPVPTPAPSTPAAAPTAPAEKVIMTAVDPPARHATSADMIIITDQDFPGRHYTRVGDVRSEVHPKSMFPKTPSRDLLNADMKAQALRLGADAVVQVKYDSHNALTSTKGDIATGVAVRFD